MKKLYYMLIALAIPLHGLCQEVNGVVKDMDSHPIADVLVMVAKTKKSAITDNQGRFTLHTGLQEKLIFSGSHVESLRLDIAGKTNITVTMTLKINKLDEVQIIGYGTSTQRFNVGSVTKISAEDIGSQPVSNPLSVLQGRVAGLTISSTSGLPGSAVKVQVRGQNTLNPIAYATHPVDNPLYIVDGVPYATQNENLNQYSSIAAPGSNAILNNDYGGISPFSSLDPETIESIEILRDADATAIYGSRGGNGVILITTKKGKAGQTLMNVNVKQGISQAGNTMPMMDTYEYLKMRREAFANDGTNPSLVPYSTDFAPDLLTFDQNRNTDWKKVFLDNTATYTAFTASLTGGSEATQFYLSTNYNRNTYVLPGDFSDQKAGVMLSMGHKSADKRFQLDFSSNYSYTKNTSSGTVNLLSAYNRVPNYPDAVDSRGNLLWQYDGVNFLDATLYNPFAYLKERYHIQNNMLNSSLNLSVRPLMGLTVKTSLGYNFMLSDEYSGVPKAAQNPLNYVSTYANFGKNNFNTWIVEPQLTYNRNWGNGVMNILVGGTMQRNSNSSIAISAEGYSNDKLIESIAGAPSTQATDNYSLYKYAAIFGRINYIWYKKYIFNLNIRRDGSSRFGPDKRFGNFGSAAAGWLFTEEKWLKSHVAFLSYGKLRGSFGITGSDATSPYQYIARWAPTSTAYNGQIGYTPQNLLNTELSWANTKKTELGLELGFFADKYLLNIAWYRNRTGSQLTNYTLPVLTGFTSIPVNWDAVVQNTGIELTLNSKLASTKQFSWNLGVNMSMPKNKLKSFKDLEKSSYATYYLVDKSLNTVNGFRYAGVNRETGIFQFYNNKGEITSSPTAPQGGNFNDYSIIGNLDPKFFGGIQNTFQYKQVKLDFLFEFRKQMGRNFLSQVYASSPGGMFNLPSEMDNRWRQPGDEAEFQKVSANYGDAYRATTFFTQSDGVFSDASYIRLKSISCSYSIPYRISGKSESKKLQVIISSQNLFTITKYKGNDPETQSFYGIPPLRTIIVGLQVAL